MHSLHKSFDGENRSRRPELYFKLSNTLVSTDSGLNRAVKCNVTNFQIIFIKRQNPIIR